MNTLQTRISCDVIESSWFSMDFKNPRLSEVYSNLDLRLTAGDEESAVVEELKPLAESYHSSVRMAVIRPGGSDGSHGPPSSSSE